MTSGQGPQKIALSKRAGSRSTSPTEEPIQRNVAAGRLRFTESTAEGVANSEVIFIAVPTLPQPDGFRGPELH